MENEELQEEREDVEEREEEAADEGGTEEEIAEDAGHRAEEFADLVERLEKMQDTLDRIESMYSAFVENGATVREESESEDVPEDGQEDEEYIPADVDDLDLIIREDEE